MGATRASSVIAPVLRNAGSPEEAEHQELYDLDDEQMAWRRAKILELKDPVLFRQEYPATAAEAFQMSGHDSYIPPELIARARKASVEPSGPLVIGLDPAWMGVADFATVRIDGAGVLPQFTHPTELAALL